MEGIELGGDQQFCLRWNNFQANITSQFEALRDDEDFVDVTLACEGHRLEAHKVVLSACSPYFKDLFKNNPCPHPIIFMRDCELIHITALLEFMYAGEVNIAQAQLTSFLRTAEALQIRGLTDSSSKTKSETKHSSLKSPPSQLRNLLCGKSSTTTSPSKVVNQILEPFNDDKFDKTALHQSDTRRTTSDSENNHTHNNDIHPSSSHVRPAIDSKEHINYGAVRLKSDLLLKERNTDNSDVRSNGNNAESEKGKGKINPLAVNNVVNFRTNPELLQSIIEPKLETPDYASDEEMRQDRLPITSDLFFGSNQITNPFAAHQGNVDFLNNTGRDFNQDAIEGNGYLMHRHARHLLNKNMRNRTSAQWPDFRVPATINHDEEETDRPPKLIKLAEGIEVVAERLRGVKWGDYRKVTRALAAALFSPSELATSSVTGQRWSRAGQEQRPTKPPLDRRRVQALISYVSRRFPGIEVSRIKQVLAYKCKENCAAFRMRAASDNPQLANVSNFSLPSVLSHDESTVLPNRASALDLGSLGVGRSDSPSLEISDESGTML